MTRLTESFCRVTLSAAGVLLIASALIAPHWMNAVVYSMGGVGCLIGAMKVKL